MERCSTQVLDLLGAKNGAEGIERAQLLARMFDRIEAAAGAGDALRMIGVPREGWRPLVEHAVGQLHTWSRSNLSEVRGRVTDLSRATSDDIRRLTKSWT